MLICLPDQTSYRIKIRYDLDVKTTAKVPIYGIRTVIGLLIISNL